MSNPSTTPLLPKPTMTSTTTTTTTTAGPNTTAALLAVLKVAFGLGCLLAPGLAHTALLLAPPSPQAAVVTRLYGGAVVSLGYLLWAQNRACFRPPSSSSSPTSTLASSSGEGVVQRSVSVEMLKHVVAVNIAADAVDVVSCTAGYISGALGLRAFAMVGGGCLALEVLGWIAYGTL